MIAKEILSISLVLNFISLGAPHPFGTFNSPNFKEIFKILPKDCIIWFMMDQMDPLKQFSHADQPVVNENSLHKKYIPKSDDQIKRLFLYRNTKVLDNVSLCQQLLLEKWIQLYRSALWNTWNKQNQISVKGDPKCWTYSHCKSQLSKHILCVSFSFCFEWKLFPLTRDQSTTSFPKRSHTLLRAVKKKTFGICLCTSNEIRLGSGPSMQSSASNIDLQSAFIRTCFCNFQCCKHFRL